MILGIKISVEHLIDWDLADARGKHVVLYLRSKHESDGRPQAFGGGELEIVFTVLDVNVGVCDGSFAANCGAEALPQQIAATNPKG